MEVSNIPANATRVNIENSMRVHKFEYLNSIFFLEFLVQAIFEEIQCHQNDIEASFTFVNL